MVDNFSTRLEAFGCKKSGSNSEVNMLQVILLCQVMKKLTFYDSNYIINLVI